MAAAQLAHTQTWGDAAQLHCLRYYIVDATEKAQNSKACADAQLQI
jgi:hypothetical protein